MALTFSSLDHIAKEGANYMGNSVINSEYIAKKAGVSRSTVSRVINGYPNVPKKTRDRILKIIEEYNYSPNISAQVLKGKSMNTIGMFFIPSGAVTDNLLNTYYIASVIENAAMYGYHVLSYIIRDTSDEATIKAVKDVFRQHRIDAGIFKGISSSEPLLEELVEEGFLVGVIDYDFKDRDEKNLVIVNYECLMTAMNAVDYVVGLNHRKIAVMNGDTNMYSGVQRNTGFQMGIEKNISKIDKYWTIPGVFSKSSGYEQMKNFLKNASELPTAVCASNDSVAFGAIDALTEYGLKVPDDISVIGIDDHVLSRYTTPALTTLKVNFRDIYKVVTTKLIEIIENGDSIPPVRVEFDSLLIERESCRRI